MRRSIVLAVLVGALVGVIAVAGVSVAGSGSDSKQNSSQKASGSSFQAQYAAKRNAHQGRRGGRGHRGHGFRFGPVAMALTGVSERLNVSKDELIEAAKGVKDRGLDRAVSEGVITQAERDALEQCLKAHHQRGGPCADRRAARRAHRKLHREMRERARTDLPGVKSQLIGDLAAELGKDPKEVEDALRAEMVELLDTGVKLGFVTEKARTLAIGCFDQPAQCDLRALRREVRQRFGGRGHRGHHGGRGRHP